MRDKFLIAAALLGLGACSTTGGSVSTTAAGVSAMQSAASVLATGQLVCGVGSAALAALDASGNPVFAKNNTAQYVNAACASIGGVAISPPAAGVPGKITVTVPATS